MKSLRHSGRVRPAFTLMEIMVAMVVMMIVLPGVLAFAYFSHRSYGELSRNSIAQYANTRVLANVSNNIDCAGLVRVYASFDKRQYRGVDTSGEFAVLVHFHPALPGDIIAVSRIVTYHVDRTNPSAPVLRTFRRDFPAAAPGDFKIVPARFEFDLIDKLDELLPPADGSRQGLPLADLDRLVIQKLKKGAGWSPFRVSNVGICFNISIPVSGGSTTRYDALVLTNANFNL